MAVWPGSEIIGVPASDTMEIIESFARSMCCGMFFSEYVYKILFGIW